MFRLNEIPGLCGKTQEEINVLLGFVREEIEGTEVVAQVEQSIEEFNARQSALPDGKAGKAAKGKLTREFLEWRTSNSNVRKLIELLKQVQTKFGEWIKSTNVERAAVETTRNDHHEESPDGMGWR